jgi:hypothetical protein
MRDQDPNGKRKIDTGPAANGAGGQQRVSPRGCRGRPHRLPRQDDATLFEQSFTGPEDFDENPQVLKIVRGPINTLSQVFADPVRLSETPADYRRRIVVLCKRYLMET